MNLDLLRSFFVIVELGSLNRAAERLRVSQSTLTRQVRALEQEIGGALLERSTSGVALTGTGHALLDGMRPVLAQFDAALLAARTLARGQSSALRIGYLPSAAAEYLHPALAALRKAQPDVKVKLFDQSPGEQIAALRRGEIDIGMVGQAGAFLTKEFYVRKIASLPVVVSMAENHPLATGAGVKLADLREDFFIGALESDLPGHNRWITQLCRKAGFRPRFLQDAESLMHGLALTVTEGAVGLMPDSVKKTQVPGVVFRPLKDSAAKWELTMVWQRGKVSAPVKALLDALPK